MLKIRLDGNFHLSYKEFMDEYSFLNKEVEQRIDWFKKNSEDSRLDNHALRKRMDR